MINLEGLVGSWEGNVKFSRVQLKRGNSFV